MSQKSSLYILIIGLLQTHNRLYFVNYFYIHSWINKQRNKCFQIIKYVHTGYMGFLFMFMFQCISAPRTSTLLYPVSLLFGCWDRVQGGDPLYGLVKCILGHRGQIWPIWTRFFCKKGIPIWIRGMTFFCRPHIHFFGRQNWPFLRGLTKCQNGGEMSEWRRREEIVMHS